MIRSLPLQVALLWLRTPQASLTFFFSFFLVGMAGAAETPVWIWAESPRGDVGEVVFRAELTTSQTTDDAAASIRSATIHGGADFCHVEIHVNGAPIAVIDAFADWFDVDLSKRMKRGKNVIELRAHAVEGPSAVAARVSVELANGKQVVLDTGTSWTARVAGKTATPLPRASGVPSGVAAGVAARDADLKVVELGAVLPEMWIPARPAKINPFDDYTQWKRALGGGGEGGEGGEADTASFEVAEGYQIQRVLKASKDQSSWVSMGVSRESSQSSNQTLDRGVLIGREDQGFLRVKFSADGSATIEDVPCDQELKEVRGITQSSDGHWIVNANNSKSLYSLVDDGRRIKATRWREFPGGVGHGRNDLFWTEATAAKVTRGEFRQLTSEPTIYSIHGDAVEVPRGDDVEDWTSPLRPRRDAREGHLLRIRPQGDKRSVAIVSAGLRNPFGVAMNLDGERFTYDADAEFDMGAPWYRPTRMVHLVSGADYGWRGVTGSWPPYFPDHADNALPLCDIGKGSPTAVAFGYQGKFPRADRYALYVLDWAYGRVLRVHMTPRGAGYRARSETFLRGRPLNVTDIDFHQGQMLLITGGRKTQSNLYRIRYTGKWDDPERSSDPQQTRREAFGGKQRRVRRRLEQLHRSHEGNEGDEGDEDSRRELAVRIQVEIWPYLADADPQIRYAARVALEHQPSKLWQSMALKESSAVTAMTALTALAHTLDAPHEQILERLNELDWKSLSSADQARMIQCDAVCLRNQSISKAVRQDCQQRHLRMYKAATIPTILPTGIGHDVAQSSLLLLLEQGVPESTELAVKQLASANTQRDEMFYLYILRTAKNGWTSDSRKTYFETLQHTSEYLGGDGMPGFIRQIHEQSTATLTDAERGVLGELTELREGVEPPPAPRALVKKRSLPELLVELKGHSAPGDPERGRIVFKQALCARCHRMGAVGRPVGPELTSVGSRFRIEDLLRSVIEPSAVVADKYRQDEVLTVDGRRLTGLGVWGGDYRSPTLRLVTNPLRPADVVEIPKSEIASHKKSPHSAMPTGLLDTFEVGEIKDLLAYLRRDPVD